MNKYNICNVRIENYYLILFKEFYKNTIYTFRTNVKKISVF